MAEQTENTEIYVDLLPNQKKDEAERQRVADRLQQELEGRLDESIDRSWKLPAIMVKIEGEYLELLIEARQLYVNGYFYSCVAMCGIVNERLIKDVVLASIWIEKEGVVYKPDSEVLKKLEHVDSSRLSEFIAGAGLVAEEACKASQKLVRLRNDHAHARGGKPDKDALDAINHLHKVVEGTVSVYRKVVTDTRARH